MIIPKSLEALAAKGVALLARDEAVQIKRARLRDAIGRGYDDVIAGRIIVLENEDQIDAFVSDL